MGGQGGRWQGEQGEDRVWRLEGFEKGAVQKRALQEGGEAWGRGEATVRDWAGGKLKNEQAWVHNTIQGLSLLLCPHAISALFASRLAAA